MRRRSDLLYRCATSGAANICFLVLNSNEAILHFGAAGVPVLAASRALEGTPWFLVAKIDRDEIFASVYTLTSTAVILILVTIGLVGSLLGQVWRHERLRDRVMQLNFFTQVTEGPYRGAITEAIADPWLERGGGFEWRGSPYTSELVADLMLQLK